MHVGRKHHYPVSAPRFPVSIRATRPDQTGRAGVVTKASSRAAARKSSALAAEIELVPATSPNPNDMPILDQLTDTASQFAGIYANFKNAGRAPAAPKPAAAPAKSNTGLLLGLGGGALVLVLVLVFAFRK